MARSPYTTRSGKSIRSDLFLLLIFIAVFPITVYLYLDFFSLKNRLDENARENLMNNSKAIHGELKTLFSEYITALRHLSESPAVLSRHLVIDKITAEMDTTLKYYPAFTRIALLNESGEPLCTTHGDLSDIDKIIDISPASIGSGLILIPPANPEAGENSIKIIVPAIIDDKTRYLVGEMGFDKIWQISDRTKVGKSGFIVITDARGNIIAHPDKKSIGKKITEFDVKDSIARKIPEIVTFSSPDTGAPYIGAINAIGAPLLSLSSPLVIIAVQPKNEAYEFSNFIIVRDLLQLIAVTSFVILISLYFSTRITKPIEKIIDATDTIAAGKFGGVLDMRSWEELNNIARAFNEMSKNLEKFTRELKESEKKYRTLVEDIDDGYYLIKNEAIVYANNAFSRILGFEGDEVIGKNFFDLFPESAKAVARNHYDAVLTKDDTPHRFELSVLKRDGEEIFLEFRPKRISEGEEAVIAGIFVDVSLRREREAFLENRKRFLEEEIVKKTKELFESELKFRTIFESAADGIFLAEKNGVVLSVNKALVGILGFDPTGMESASFFKRINERGVLDVETLFKQKKSAKTQFSTSLSSPDKGAVHLDITMNPLFLGKKRQFLQGIVRDTTEREHLLSGLIQSRNRLQTAFDAVSNRMYLIDERYTLKFVNRKISEEFNIHYREILNNKCYHFFNSDDSPCAGCPFADVIAERREKNHEVFVGRDDKNQYFDVSIFPTPSHENTTDYLVFSREITEEKQIKDHLIQNDRLISLGQLSSGIAHEINNPLTAILGYAQVLREATNPGNAEYQDLKIIEDQAKNCKSILDDLLLFSRARMNQKDFFPITDALSAVIQLTANEIRTKNITVRTRFADNLPPFFGDQIKITQVFLNIINNSIYAVKAGGEMIIETGLREEENQTVISFIDNGMGIREEDKKRIFDPFFTTKPPGMGTGFGLSVSYGIVREHGGDIFAESTHGKGTSLTIILPNLEKNEP